MVIPLGRSSWETPSTQPTGEELPYPVRPQRVPRDVLVQGRYRVRFAGNANEREAALRLRFEVFNLELHEGLASSYRTGRDEDPFDAVCHHLIVEDIPSERVIGTYRLQTHEMARRYRGFYSAGEFDLVSLGAEVLAASVEIGRACVARDHRHRRSLFLLWKGLATYLRHNGKRYLFGCCSLPTLDAGEGLRVLDLLEREGRMHPSIHVEPLPHVDCRLAASATTGTGGAEPSLPILFRTYLRYGAQVCGPPALDREFGTTDFFVIFDADAMTPGAREMFFGTCGRQ